MTEPEPTPDYVYKAVYVSNHDGDNVRMQLDHGKFPESKTITEAELRVNNLRCAELDEPGGVEARDFATILFKSAERITVKTFKTPTGVRKTFARTVADIWIDGQLFADRMVSSGFGEYGKGVGV